MSGISISLTTVFTFIFSVLILILGLKRLSETRIVDYLDNAIELYDIKWLELHWKKISSTLERNETSLQERKEDISAFAKWYKDFVSEWNYTEFDTVIFEERINILKALITVNNKWETNLKNMTVSFKRSKKILTEKIDKLTKKGENAL